MMLLCWSRLMELTTCLCFVFSLDFFLPIHQHAYPSLVLVQPAATHALHIDTSTGAESAHSSSSAHIDASPSPEPSPPAVVSSPSAGDEDAELVKIQKQQQQQLHDEQLSLQSPDAFSVNGGFDFRGEQVWVPAKKCDPTDIRRSFNAGTHAVIIDIFGALFHTLLSIRSRIFPLHMYMASSISL